MDLDYSIGATSSIGARMGALAGATGSTSTAVSRCLFNGAYTAAPGLSQLAANHASVLLSGAGSAKAVLDSYQQQVDWLHSSLRANVSAISGQDDCMAHAMERNNASPVQQCTVDPATFPMRPEEHYDNFMFTPPLVNGIAPLKPVLAAFEATNTAMVDNAAAQWNNAADAIDKIAGELDGLAKEIVDVNTGVPFDAASARIAETAQTGHNFAANARTMAASVSKLNEIKDWAVAALQRIDKTVSTVPDTLARSTLEAEFMAKFMNMDLPAAIQQGVPPITNLMQAPPPPPAQETTANIGMTQTATAGLPLDGANVAGFLSNAGTAVNAVKNVVDGVNAIAGGAGPNGIGGVGALGGLGNAHTLMEAGRHMLNPGNLAATTAGLGTATLGGTNPALPGLGGASTGMGASGLGAMALGAGGFGGGRGGFGGAPGVGNVIGGNMSPRSVGSVASALGDKGAYPAGAMTGMGGAYGANNRRGGRSGTRAFHTSTGIGGAGGGFDVSGPGGFGGSGVGVGAGGANGGAMPRGGFGAGGSIAGAGSAGGVGGSAASAARGGAPMMGGMPMAGGGARGNKKAKAVTSTVEAEGNVADLLGTPRRIVPGVIGDWVRG